MTDAQGVAPQSPAAQAQGILDGGQPLVPVIDENGVPLGVLAEQNLLVAAPERKKRFGWF